MIVDAPLYVPITVIRRDLRIPTIKEEIRRYSSQYSAQDVVVTSWSKPTTTGCCRQDAYSEDICRKMRTKPRSKTGKHKQIKLYNVIAASSLMYRTEWILKGEH
jgi:hypothetical protein